MRVNIRKLLSTLATAVLAASLILTGAPALAQAPGNELSFDDMGIEILPEYDQPSPQILVIYEGVLYNRTDKPFSGDVVFFVPKGADVRSTCELSADPLRNSNVVHNNRRSFAKVTDRGDYLEVAMPVSKPVNPKEGLPFHMEIYYPGVTGGPDKAINFKYTPTYSAKKLLVHVIQPAQSTNYKSTPAPQGVSSDSDKLTVNQYEIPDIQVGKPVTLDISYTRSVNGPSVTGSGNQGGEAGQGLTFTGSKSAVIVGILVVAILGALFFVGSKPKTPKTRARTGRPAQPEPVSRNRSKSAAGKPAGSKAAASGGGVSGGNISGGSVEEEKRRARKLLLEGRISEETYKEIIRDLEGPGRARR